MPCHLETSSPSCVGQNNILIFCNSSRGWEAAWSTTPLLHGWYLMLVHLQADQAKHSSKATDLLSWTTSAAQTKTVPSCITGKLKRMTPGLVFSSKEIAGFLYNYLITGWRYIFISTRLCNLVHTRLLPPLRFHISLHFHVLYRHT